MNRVRHPPFLVVIGAVLLPRLAVALLAVRGYSLYQEAGRAQLELAVAMDTLEAGALG